MSNWRWVKDDSHKWKGHVVADSLEVQLIDDLVQRVNEGEAPDFTTEPIADCFMDLPGMVWMGRTIMTVEVEGLKVEIPAQDWAIILDELKLREERTFAGSSATPYYKYHGWRWCLVLTPAQRRAMIQGMEAKLEEAQIVGDSDNRRFQEGINAINDKLGRKGVVVARVEAMNEADKGKKGSN